MCLRLCNLHMQHNVILQLQCSTVVFELRTQVVSLLLVTHSPMLPLQRLLLLLSGVIAHALGAMFYTIEETGQWQQYFTPWNSNRCVPDFPRWLCNSLITNSQNSVLFREYFQASRPQNPTQLYVCAGHGRTGTTTFKLLFKELGIEADHAGGVVSLLEHVALLENRTKLPPVNGFVSLLPPNSPPLAVMDIPVNTFVWDLLDAYPNSTVSLAVRKVRPSIKFCKYVLILI